MVHDSIKDLNSKNTLFNNADLGSLASASKLYGGANSNRNPEAETPEKLRKKNRNKS